MTNQSCQMRNASDSRLQFDQIFENQEGLSGYFINKLTGLNSTRLCKPSYLEPMSEGSGSRDMTKGEATGVFCATLPVDGFSSKLFMPESELELILENPQTVIPNSTSSDLDEEESVVPNPSPSSTFGETDSIPSLDPSFIPTSSNLAIFPTKVFPVNSSLSLTTTSVMGHTFLFTSGSGRSPTPTPIPNMLASEFTSEVEDFLLSIRGDLEAAFRNISEDAGINRCLYGDEVVDSCSRSDSMMANVSGRNLYGCWENGNGSSLYAREALHGYLKSFNYTINSLKECNLVSIF